MGEAACFCFTPVVVRARLLLPHYPLFSKYEMYIKYKEINTIAFVQAVFCFCFSLLLFRQ